MSSDWQVRDNRSNRNRVCLNLYIGFNYNFDSLNPTQTNNELSDAFAAMFHGRFIHWTALLQLWIPFLRLFVRELTYCAIHDPDPSKAHKTATQDGCGA